MEVLADVAVNGYVLIRQGAPVIGVVSRAKEAKILGRRGHVAVSLKYAEAVTGERVPVSGDLYESGNGKKAKMATEAAQQIYAQRSRIAEFPHAWIKERCGLRQFRCRGRLKATMEATWAALSYNLTRWFALRRRPTLTHAALAPA